MWPRGPWVQVPSFAPLTCLERPCFGRVFSFLPSFPRHAFRFFPEKGRSAAPLPIRWRGGSAFRFGPVIAHWGDAISYCRWRHPNKKQPLLIALRFLKTFAGGPNGEDAFAASILTTWNEMVIFCSGRASFPPPRLPVFPRKGTKPPPRCLSGGAAAPHSVLALA